ncbi:MFS transporter [Candidatus Peregrinibacteria bacterium]|nr:MFS transporter [Candidatus Peregrinibacteria bacterium]
MENSEVKKTMMIFYVLSGLTSLGTSFILATYVMFQRAHNLDYLESNICNFVFLASMFIFEVPTGAIADVYGRKTSFVISCFLLGTSMFAYGASSSFLSFLLAETICGLALTFATGAFEAWAVDRLKQLGSETTINHLMVRQAQIEKLGAMCGAALGAWLNNKNIVIPWIAAGSVQIFTGLAALILMKEEGFKPKANSLQESHQALKSTVKNSLSQIKQNQAVGFTVISGALYNLCLQPTNMQWQPYFSSFLGANTTPLGFIFAAIMIAVMIGAEFANKWTSIWKSSPNAMIAAKCFIGLSIITTSSLTKFPAILSFFLLHEVIRGIYWPIKDAYIHNNITSEERATTISFESMVRQIGGMIGLLASGLAAKYTSIPLTWGLSGLALLISALWLWKRNKT